MVFSDRLELLCQQSNRARAASESATIPDHIRRGWNARQVAFDDALRILEVPIKRDESGYIVSFEVMGLDRAVRS